MSRNSNVIFNGGTINGSINQNYNSTNHQEDENLKKYKDNKYVKRYDANAWKQDVAISYASKEEHYVSRVVNILEMEGIKVFFAPRREEEFLGMDLITKFYEIYRYESLFVAGFISEDYLKKDITMHEAKTALLREKSENRNCFIPVCFQDKVLEGLNPDVHYLNGDKLKEVEVADKIKLIIETFKNSQTVIQELFRRGRVKCLTKKAYQSVDKMKMKK